MESTKLLLYAFTASRRVVHNRKTHQPRVVAFRHGQRFRRCLVDLKGGYGVVRFRLRGAYRSRSVNGYVLEESLMTVAESLAPLWLESSWKEVIFEPVTIRAGGWKAVTE